MADIVHLLAAIGGVLILVVFFRSIVTVALINRQPDDPLLVLSSRLTKFALLRRSPPSAPDARTLRRGAWYWPVSQLVLIGTWFVLVVFGFALLNWAADSVPDFGAALIASGSALSTLGFATPSDPQGQVLAIVEASVGLGIVVFIFTFIPGYLATVQQREDQVAWVYRRAGSRPTGTDLLEWLARAGGVTRIGETWNGWESWFRDLGETHALSPMLSFDLSLRPGQSWVVAYGAMLDAASLALVAVAETRPTDAQACLDTGIDSLLMIESALTKGLRAKPPDIVPSRPAREDFDHACDRLEAAGVRCTADPGRAFEAFVELRSRYAAVLLRLAAVTRSGDMPSLGSQSQG